MLPKAGQSENLTDQSAVTPRVLTPLQDAPVAPEPKPYSPAVGDVVEDDEDIGMILSRDGDLRWIAISKACGIDYYNKPVNMKWLSDSISSATLVDKTEYHPTTYQEGFDALKAYFARPQFKVGDEVKVVKKVSGTISWNAEDMGLSGKVLLISTGDSTVQVDTDKHGSYWLNTDSLEPAPAPALTEDDDDDLDW
jgi:hypothetical protein